MSKEEAVFPAPPALSLYHIPHHWISTDEDERLKKRWIEEGFYVHEEEYLLANFPADMATPAQEYLDKEMVHIRQRIRNEAFQYWYGFRPWRSLR